MMVFGCFSAIPKFSLQIPVLIIQETTDLQVNKNDARLLLEVKPDSKIIIIDNMNHALDSDAQKIWQDDKKLD
jgi:hypothetical protein